MSEDILQQWLWDLFADQAFGLLVDVGAGNGVSGSLSYRFLTEKGWKGILVDPLPVHAKALRRLYHGNSEVTVVECAAMPEEGSGPLWPFREVSTTRHDWAQACENHWEHVHYPSLPLMVEYRRMDDILNGFPLSMDLLKIDTEGRDLEILKSMDWERRKFRVIVVEILDMLHPGDWTPSEDLIQFMSSIGMSLKLTTKAGNAVFCKGV